MDFSFPKPTNQTVKAPTTILQEHCSLANFQRPLVELYFIDGVFVCRVTVVEINLSGYGSGERRTVAQEQAAERLIGKLTGPDSEAVKQRPRIEGGLVELLNGLCQIADLALPDYEVYTDDEDERVFVAMCQVGNDMSYGTGLSQNEAMQVAAKDMIDTILERQHPIQGEHHAVHKPELVQKFKAARMQQRMDTTFYKARQKFQEKYGGMKGQQ